MKLFISPGQVAEIAFPPAEHPVRDIITEAAVLSAQEKFLRPVLGGLYDKLACGEFPQFMEEYIKPALAFYVKMLVLPVIAARTGPMGIVTLKGGNMQPAGAGDVSALRRQTRAEANALMRRAVEHLEADPGRYPGYVPAENVMNRISISSQIVL